MVNSQIITWDFFVDFRYLCIFIFSFDPFDPNKIVTKCAEVLSKLTRKNLLSFISVFSFVQTVNDIETRLAVSFIVARTLVISMYVGAENTCSKCGYRLPLLPF